MVYEVPSDLIKQVQILLRKEAGLECYNPDDDSASLPNPPTLEEVIARFDPSSDDLRCNHCKGRLLRGVESIICVYCGREQEKDTVPDPLSFKSTVGFRWLLDSLGLDGSEIVEQPVEHPRNSKVQRFSTTNNKLLVDFLDLELKWPDKSERFGITSTSETETRSEKLSNLAGLASEDLFSVAGEEAGSSVSSDQFLQNETSKSKESTSVKLRGSLSLFENEKSSKASLKPEVEQGASFSGWEAEFQSVGSHTQDSGMTLHDPSNAFAVDHGSQMDSLFGPVKDYKEERSEGVTSFQAPIFNWVANDPGRNSHLEESPTKKPEANIVLEDTGINPKLDNPSSASLNWFHENQPQSSSLELPKNVKTVGDDSYDAYRDSSSIGEHNNQQTSSSFVPDSTKSRVNDGLSDAWSDFTSSRSLFDTQPQNSVQRSEDVALDDWNDFTSLSIQPSPVKASVEKDQGDSLGLWGDYASSATEADHRQDGEKKSPANDAIKVDESTFDIWGDFSGSFEQGHDKKVNHKEVADSEMTGEGQNINDIWDGFMSLNNAEDNVKRINSAKTFEATGISENDDLFDAWNGFKSSTNLSNNLIISTTSMMQDSFEIPDGQQQAANKQAPETKKIVVDDDLLKSWGDFRSSGNAMDSILSRATVVSDSKTNSGDTFSSSISPLASQQQTSSSKAPQNGTLTEDEDLFNTWREFKNQSTIAEMPKNEISSEDNVLFGGLNNGLSNSGNPPDNQQLGNSEISAVDSKITYTNEYPLDDTWTDFTNSTNVLQNHPINNMDAPDDKVAQHDDPFDAWNVPASSSGQMGNPVVASQQSLSEENSLFTGHNSLGAGINGLLQPVASAGGFGSRVASSQPDSLPLEALPLFSAKAEVNSGKSKKGEEISQETSTSKSIDAESLISQLHDLSFMLESSLSIPKR